MESGGWGRGKPCEAAWCHSSGVRPQGASGPLPVGHLCWSLEPSCGGAAGSRRPLHDSGQGTGASKAQLGQCLGTGGEWSLPEGRGAMEPPICWAPSPSQNEAKVEVAQPWGRKGGAGGVLFFLSFSLLCLNKGILLPPEWEHLNKNKSCGEIPACLPGRGLGKARSPFSTLFFCGDFRVALCQCGAHVAVRR